VRAGCALQALLDLLADIEGGKTMPEMIPEDMAQWLHRAIRLE